MIKIIADSCCDLPPKFIKEFDLTILPMSITFGEESFADQETITTKEFYRRLTSGQMSSTAYPSLGLLQQALEKELAAGNQVFVFTIADPLSGYYKASTILAEQFKGQPVTVINSKSATMSEGVIVLETARQIQKGKTYAELQELIPKIVERSRGYGAISNLDYLHRGGRINGATAKIATALNIKPVINVEADGSLEVCHKVRGIQKAITWLAERIKEDGTDFSDTTLFIGYITQKENAEALLEKLKAELTLGEVILWEVGPTVGTHLGPGCVALFYLKPEC